MNSVDQLVDLKDQMLAVVSDGTLVGRRERQKERRWVDRWVSSLVGKKAV
jgi:hypothetical protein